jgi:hypothetical protein
MAFAQRQEANTARLIKIAEAKDLDFTAVPPSNEVKKKDKAFL